LTLANLFRLGVGAAMTFYVFCMYGMVRTMNGGLGFNAGATATAALGSMALMVPLVWLVGVPELPEMYVQSIRANRRWRSGLCPGCAYPLPMPRSGQCPECGREFVEPRAHRFSLTTIWRFAIMLALAWLIGCAAGEAWTLVDEAAFMNEAGIALADPQRHSYERPRRWPGAGDHLKLERSAAGGD
jgi:hypothetical protein